ncbi:MAG: hypothetical protein ACK5OR_01375 [Betaproteobacteria bacterium]|jgi:hypothetical protein
MRTAICSTCLLCAAVLAGCGTGQAPVNDSPPARAAAPAPAAVEVVDAQFGVFGIDPNGRRVLLETARLPAVAAEPYGWYIVYKTSKPTIVWREEFELPEPPPTWGIGEALGVYTISPDRKTAVTERIVPTRVGFIANEWRYAPGDPTGAHAMRIYIDGQLIREFKFDIDPAPDAPPRDPHHRNRGSSGGTRA